jgi:hypothetical protein
MISIVNTFYYLLCAVEHQRLNAGIYDYIEAYYCIVDHTRAAGRKLSSLRVEETGKR